MSRNFDLDHCANSQEAVIAAYVEELEERQKDRRRGLGDEPGSIENNVLVPNSDEKLPEPPAHGKLEVGTEQHEEAEGLCGFLFL